MHEVVIIYVTRKSYLHFIAWPAVRIFDLVLGPFTHSRRPYPVGGITKCCTAIVVGSTLIVPTIQACCKIESCENVKNNI